MKKSLLFTTFEEYIEHQPKVNQKILLELSSYILSVVPNSTPLINYNIPAFALIEGGTRDYQIMIAGYQKHIGFYPHPTTIEHFWDRLSAFKKAKGSVQFPIAHPLPKQLIIEMVNYRKQLIDQTFKQ